MPGIVACVHPRAAEEGAKVLEAGGNAFDAAVATAFVQMIVTPFSCGVGGMVSAHVLSREHDAHVIVDGCLRAGSRVTEDMWVADYKGEGEFSGESLFEDYRSTMGYTSICTPGAVAALGEVHRRFCTLPWRDLLQPAIRIAQQGFPVLPGMAQITHEEPEPYIPTRAERLSASSDCAALYLKPDGAPFHADDTLTNPAYADTLTQLAERGADDFYNGDLAARIGADLEQNGAYVTRDDLANYATKSYAPTTASYRDYTVYSNGAPGGGPLLLQALNVLAGFDLPALGHGSVDYLAHMGSTLQLVNQDRCDFLGDPDVLTQPPESVLLSPERTKQLRAAVAAGTVGGVAPPQEHADTTHLTVVDAAGNIACITHSNGNHSGIITPGTGFVYNNGMNRFEPRPGRASSFAPGKARLHLMMPAIATRGSTPVVAWGAPGGNAILSALVQAFINVVDFGMTAAEAVTAPRIHAEGDTIWCDARMRTDVCAELRARGFMVEQDPTSYPARFALCQLVTLGDDGTVDGGSDPRGEGGVFVTR
jgi:gamma-glutamyltranspeptidase/glutathione hydrolase